MINVHSFLCKIFGVGDSPELSRSAVPPQIIFLLYEGIEYLVTEVTRGKTNLQYGENKSSTHLSEGINLRISQIRKEGSLLKNNTRIVIDIKDF